MTLPYLDRRDASPPVAEALDALPDLSLFRMVAHAQTAFGPWLAFGGAMLSALSLDAKLRELAILHVAALTDCEYEWVQHEAIARGVGVRDDQIAAVHAGLIAGACLDAAEQAALRFTSEVIEEHRASPEATDALCALTSPREVVELLLVVGQYLAVASIARTTGIETDAAAQMAVVDIAAQSVGRA